MTLHDTPAEQSLAAVHRSNQKYYEQLAERRTFACGIAFTCPEFPDVDVGNHVREAIVPAGEGLADAVREVEAYYAELGLTCYRWVPAAGQSIEPLEAVLLERGYRASRVQTMILTRPCEIPVRSDVRILPARAMRKAMREVILSREGEPAQLAMWADADNERLDDPNYDMFVALVGGRPAATGTLFQVGEIGRIDDVCVVPAMRRQGVGLTMMAHLVAMSRRLALRYTVLEVDPENAAAIRLYERCGFEPGASYVEFVVSRSGSARQ
jgi:ribosomal protein S18 acetylase RimI-like enzyme